MNAPRQRSLTDDLQLDDIDMLLLTCPVCGLKADEDAFKSGGESHLMRPSSASGQAGAGDVSAYLYMRENPRGSAFELWHCRHGCGKWFHAVRDTQSLQFRSYYKIGERKPVITSRRNRQK